MKNIKEDFIMVKTNAYPRLEALANEYDILLEDLVEFHNERCYFTDRISVHISNYVEYVYMPLDRYHRKKERFLESDRLIYPNILSNKVYGVVVKYFPKVLQVHYKMNISRSKQTVKLNKERIFVNNRGVEKLVEQMFEKVDKAIYPFEISVKLDGSIDNILNSKEILKRWNEDVLLKVKEYYESSLAEDMITQFNDAFVNLNSKSDLLKRNLFYKLYFLPIYIQYLNFEHKALLNIYFSSLNSSVLYKTRFILERNYTKNEKIVLRVIGNEEENFLNKDIEKGSIDIQYKLHKDTHEIFSIIGYITTYDRGIEYKIDFQLFELKDTKL